MNSFITHTGEVITGSRLDAAIAKAAAFYAANAHAILKEDAYASHVTPEQKQAYLIEALEGAAIVRGGVVNSFAAWQRINTELTGECVGKLPVLSTLRR